MTSAGHIFTDAIREYADEVAENFSLPVDADPEDQLKPLVGSLIKRVGAVVGDVNWRTEVHPDNVNGRPDLGITLNGLLVGHVELKRPGLGACPEDFTGPNKAQWGRFKELPNLIYTDGSEWSLYHSGKLSWARVRISDDIRLARIHRRRASGQCPEAARGCSCESGIMVLKQKPTPEKEHPIDATTQPPRPHPNRV